MASWIHHFLPLLLLCCSLLESRVIPAAAEESHLALGRHPRSKIFHPSTGLCATRRSIADPLKLGPCSQSDSWQYTPQRFLMVSGTYFCLQAVELGKPVKLGIVCSPSESQWSLVVSDSETTHLSTELSDGTEVCLDVDADGTLVSNSCNEFQRGDTKYLGVDSQWFKLVTGYYRIPSVKD